MYVFISPPHINPYKIKWSLWDSIFILYPFRLLVILFGKPLILTQPPQHWKLSANGSGTPGLQGVATGLWGAIGLSSWLVDRVGGAENGSSWNTIFSSFPFFGESLYFLRSYVSFQGVYTIKVRFATLKKRWMFFLRERLDRDVNHSWKWNF